MTKGIEKIVTDAMKATLKNPRETAYLLRFAASSRKASRKRSSFEEKGEHIPPFLIASITSSCNLHCAGCYSRCNEATVDAVPIDQLSDEEWDKVFSEAEDLGVSFILLAGGEPLLRQDVIRVAADHPDILFPIFTNGVFMDQRYFQLLDEHRNLLPVMSIEGGKEITDARRGKGVYDRLLLNMAELKKRDIIFGASVTVTTQNLSEVTSQQFVESLSQRGCKVVFYVEFVPVSEESKELAPQDTHRDYLVQRMGELRRTCPDVLLISFPGDEKATGGCVAAGRGFFHINSHGGAEPCPFSPYSDRNVRTASLKDILHSPLFTALQQEGVLDSEHIGGCVLHEKQAQVEALLASSADLF